MLPRTLSRDLIMKKLAAPLKKGTPTVVAVSRHPLHPMLVTFPIALLVCAPASDLAFLLFDDPFWARMSLWLLGVGTLMGTLAGTTGAILLLAACVIRGPARAWNHFVMGTMLQAFGFPMWCLRVSVPGGRIVPLGI